MKNILIISSSPNTDGLTAACVDFAEKGVKRASGGVKSISLNKQNIKSCRVCDNGWGICNSKHTCIINDDFAKIKQEIADNDSIVIITPVYWGEMSETSKCFFDRLRRCEASKYFGKETQTSVLADKNVILVAAAGGSGNGTITCLAQMERLIRHIRGKVFDRIDITRFNKRYKLQTIEEAAYELVNPTVEK